MAKIWSKTKKRLEEDLLCESLRGRVKYFVTHYHGAHDNYGRFCVRVDGKEYVRANPYNENGIYSYAYQLQDEMKVPAREWKDGRYLYDDENRVLEEIAAKKAMVDGKMDIWQIMCSIDEYMSLDIVKSLHSDNEVIRMFAILDRRVGKRTLRKIASEVEQQPEWLRFFYCLRLSSEHLI